MLKVDGTETHIRAYIPALRGVGAGRLDAVGHTASCLSLSSLRPQFPTVVDGDGWQAREVSKATNELLRGVIGDMGVLTMANAAQKGLVTLATANTQGIVTTAAFADTITEKDVVVAAFNGRTW
ncbi:hypothetical protein DFH27DRAFT_524392 [Peziza echinospora]|nr:hypothetical protein DFH27DRAFT_524392 [Peziza echinospora]